MTTCRTILHDVTCAEWADLWARRHRHLAKVPIQHEPRARRRGLDFRDVRLGDVLRRGDEDSALVCDGDVSQFSGTGSTIRSRKHCRLTMACGHALVALRADSTILADRRPLRRVNLS